MLNKSVQCGIKLIQTFHVHVSWPGSKWLQPVTKEQINKYISLCSSALLHLNYCNQPLSQLPAFIPRSHLKLPSAISSSGTTWPLFELPLHCPSMCPRHCLQSVQVFPWAALSPRNFTLVSLCAYSPTQAVVFHTPLPWGLYLQTSPFILIAGS